MCKLGYSLGAMAQKSSNPSKSFQARMENRMPQEDLETKTLKTIAYTGNFIKADLQLNEQFKSYCDMEFNDIAHGEARSMSANDKRAMELRTNSIILEDGHYQLSLLWRNNNNNNNTYIALFL